MLAAAWIFNTLVTQWSGLQLQHFLHSVIHHTKAVGHWLQHCSGNSSDGTCAKLYGLLPFPWITPVTIERGDPAAWATACLPYHPCLDIRRGGTCCMDNSLSSISPLPRHQGCGQGGPAAWATACLPYHPCTDIRDVERGTWCMGNSFSSISPLPRSAPWRGSSSAAAKRRHNMDYHSHIGLHSHKRCCSSTSTCWSWLIIHKPWPTDATVLDHNYYDHWGITALNTFILVNMTYWEINILSNFFLAL